MTRQMAPWAAYQRYLSKPDEEPEPDCTQVELDRAHDVFNRFLEHNLRLVVATVKPYMNDGRIPIDDLIGYGTLGLHRAAVKFDPDRGLKFSTYATWWIKQACWRGISESSRMIRVPVHEHERLIRINRIQRELRRDGDEPATTFDVAAELLRREDAEGQSEADVRRTMGEIEVLLRANKPLTSLNVQVGEDNDEELHSVIPDSGPTPEEALMAAETGSAVHRAIGRMAELQRRYAILRYGIYGEPTRTYAECALKLGLGIDSARKLDDEVKRTLRELLSQELRDEELVA